MAGKALAYQIDAGVVPVGGRVAMEVVEERRPVEREAVRFGVSQREGKAMVESRQRRTIFGEPINQPFRNIASSPVSVRARRWGTSIGSEA
jgi:hypothetical protein